MIIVEQFAVREKHNKLHIIIVQGSLSLLSTSESFPLSSYPILRAFILQDILTMRLAPSPGLLEGDGLNKRLAMRF